MSMRLLRTLLACALGCAFCGCAGFGYTGTARDRAPDAITEEPGWIGVADVPLYRQHALHDCGTTALAMVLRHWDHEADVARLLDRPTDQRASAADLRRLAREAGFSAFVVEGKVADLVHEIRAQRPVIVGVAKPTASGYVAHYEVVVGFHPATRRIATIDPAVGPQENSYAGFLQEWVPTGKVLIVILPVAPKDVPSAPEAGQRVARSGSPQAEALAR